MANTSSSNFKPAECPYLKDVAWRDEFLVTEGTYNHLLAIISINSISVLPTVLLNALVIFAVATRGQLRNKATILLACLAGADLLTGLLGQPIRIATEVQRLRKTGTFCGVLERVSILSLGWHIFATLSHLLLITVDRYIAIKKPLRYREIVTTRRVTVAVLLAWASTIFLRNKATILLACLAGADLLTGLLGQPIRIATEVQRLRKTGTFCGVLERVSILSLGWHIFATLSHLLLITVDRYIAIKKPLRYREIVTTRRVTVAVLLAWASTIFVAIQDSILAAINSDTNIYSVYWNLTVVTFNILGLISIIVIVAIYLYIFLEVQRQQRSQTEHLSVEEIATIRRN
ncbi:unnamed protein product, partial [Porites evermanni]